MHGPQFLLAALLLASPVWAGAEEADKAEERARASFIDQFSKFTQDKNVQGRAKTPDGKVVGGGKKNRFNQDDGLSFLSDLTYHDYSFNTIEQEEQQQGQNGQQQKPPEKRLFAHVSSHGGVSAAGGSSLLERTVYGLDKKFGKQDEQNKNKNEEEGVKYRSVFKITTKEVFEGGQGQQAASNDKAKEGEKDKVERFELRPEAKPEIEKVGDQSFETILQSARGEQNANDQQQLGNGVLLRQAAFEATKALWNSTMANLSQRRMNRAIRAGNFPVAPQISEGVPKCEEWQSIAQTEIAKAKDPKVKEKLQKDLQRMMGQCKEVAGLSYDVINPEYKQQDGGGDKLEVQGPQKEDALQRDARVQLEIMAKAGKSASDVPSNWQYGQQDDQVRMTISYDENQPKEGTRTVKEQLESYNANLKEAEDSYKDIKNRIPELEVPKPTDYAIAPGTRNMLDINQPPESAFEEVGLDNGAAASGPAARTYDELLQKAQTN